MRSGAQRRRVYCCFLKRSQICRPHNKKLARETPGRALTDRLPALATDRQPLKNGRCYVARKLTSLASTIFWTIYPSDLACRWRKGLGSRFKSVLKTAFAGWRQAVISLHQHWPMASSPHSYVNNPWSPMSRLLANEYPATVSLLGVQRKNDCATSAGLASCITPSRPKFERPSYPCAGIVLMI